MYFLYSNRHLYFMITFYEIAKVLISFMYLTINLLYFLRSESKVIGNRIIFTSSYVLAFFIYKKIPYDLHFRSLISSLIFAY